MRTLLRTALLTAAVALVAPAGAAACAGADRVPRAASLDVAGHATLCLVNQQRTSRGLQPLTADRRLAHAAVRYAREMVAHRFFAHVSAVDGSTLTSRIRSTGYVRGARAWRVGENLAWGSGGLATPRSILRSWMRSPGHRANILTAGYRHLGVGIALGAPRRIAGAAATYTTDFGARR